MNWSSPPDRDTANRRACGRARYNARRAFAAEARRAVLARQLLLADGPLKRGSFASAARELGVSRATICKDWARLKREREVKDRCHHCGSLVEGRP
ncbi:MAG: hypothetical protein K2R98_17580 [Gemmataceae bacterium]|nr:hypothetical protein [Gemmataceae bacterium]